MSSINPFSGYLASGSQVERTQAAEKSAQIKRRQQLSRNIAQQDDSLEHQVESSDTVAAAGGEQKSGQNPNRKQNKKRDGDDGQPHVDVTA